MSFEKDGGPAHPVVCATNIIAQGMTLRQYYKAAALTGILAKSLAPNSLKNHSVHHAEVSSIGQSSAARIAAEYADAMLAEDEEHGQK